MTARLFRWPDAAAFGRTVPKTKFYEHGNVRSALRERFVNDVQRVTWAFKLADSTIKLRGSTAVPEIQVFAVEAKGDDVDGSVLAAVDKSVHFPVVFEVRGGNRDRIRMVAAQKSLGGVKPSLGPYLSTGWLSADLPRAPLPVAIDLPSLYEALLASLLPLVPRRGESVSQVTDRMGLVRKLEREISALEKKLRTELQFNRKVELLRMLKAKEAELVELT